MPEIVSEAAEVILIAHQRHRGGCLCGWAPLGKSLAGHQVGMLAEAGVLVADGAAVQADAVARARRACSGRSDGDRG